MPPDRLAATSTTTTTNPTKKRKKKGRPSLLALHRRRSLRSQNPNPNPNPKSPAARRTIRRNPKPAPKRPQDVVDEDDFSDSGAHRRRRKKLRHVLRISDSADSAPQPNVEAENGIKDLGLKVTDVVQETSDCGPTTSLPDKKLLVAILDKLQKKDTYGVYSEPVDPNELPDYHDVIEHPMDFGTIRKKLADGTYSNLEQFEKDVFLICSNAMQYNGPETVYYRQAQRIQVLAQKKFENLRQQNDENEQEAQPGRRGRPPTENMIEKAGRPPAECAGSDFSTNAALSNAGNDVQGSCLSYDLSRQEINKSVLFEEPGKPCILQGLEGRNLNPEFKPDRNVDYSGSGAKGLSLRNGKKFSAMDEDRRLTYTHPQIYSSNHSSVLTAFSGERKQLLPVGLHIEHAYARSLARFATDLGPTGWEVAARLIERVLPPGMKFGHGWVGDDEIPKQSQSPLLRTSFHFGRHKAAQSPIRESIGHPLNNLIEEDSQVSTVLAQRPASPIVLNRSEDSVEVSSTNDHENGFKQENGICQNTIRSKTKAPSQLHQKPTLHATSNCLNSRMVFNQLAQKGDTVIKSYNNEAMITNSGALDVVMRKNSSVNRKSSGHFNADKAISLMADPSSSSNSNYNRDSKQQGPAPNPKTGPVPPDLNVMFQSPGSTSSSMLVDSPCPDLALQLRID